MQRMVSNSSFFIDDRKGLGHNNDFWEYDLASKQWTWLSGSKQRAQSAVYQQIGVPHPDNTPSARYGACLWEDVNGTIWLFGGGGYSPKGSPGWIHY